MSAEPWDAADVVSVPCQSKGGHQWPVLASTVGGSWAEGWIVVRFVCLRSMCGAVKEERWEMVDRGYNPE